MAVNATAVWRVRPSGSNTNGGGYDPGISGAGTDYSRQNAAQASGTAGTAAGTAAFSDVIAAAFTSAMVGNAIYITGTGFTTGFYFVTAFTDASHVTLDRSPGTGATATWNLGGAWADFWTNSDTSGNFNTASPLVAGNQVLILGAGIPNPASYSFDYTLTNYFQPNSGSATNGRIVWATDPGTPSYNGTTSGGMVCAAMPGLAWFSNTYGKYSLLWLVGNGTENAGNGVIDTTDGVITNCVFDQNGYDLGLMTTNQSDVYFSEMFSSQSARSTNVQPMLTLGERVTVLGSNIHDCIGPGISASNFSGTVINTIIAKNGDYGIKANFITAGNDTEIINCTIDGNAGDGITIGSLTSLAFLVAYGNVISNHTTAGKYGITVTAGSLAVNDRVKALIDYNSFYNNAANYNGISAGPHDVALSSNPYVAQSTENYTPA